MIYEKFRAITPKKKKKKKKTEKCSKFIDKHNIWNTETHIKWKFGIINCKWK